MLLGKIGLQKSIFAQIGYVTSIYHGKCYCLCVKMALNCLLQIEQERSEEESSVGDASALALILLSMFLLSLAGSF